MPKDMGRGPFFYHAVAPSTRVITFPTQTTMHRYSREIPQNTFPFFEPLIPQINGLPLTPDIFGRTNSTTNKFPAKPMGNFSPSTLKAKHLSNAARFATRPAGPVIDLDRGSVDKEGTQQD